MKNYKQEIEVSDDVKIKITAINFKVNLTGVEESGKVGIEIESELFDNPQQLFEIDYQEAEKTLLIKEIKQEEVIKLGKSELRVNCPRKTDLSLESDNGSVSLTELDGEVQVDSKNGMIRAKKCKGEISLVSYNGSLNLSKVEGTINLKTKNGSIEINEGNGSLQAETGNGKVRCTNTLFDKTEINVKNGSIYYEMPQIEKGTYSISSKNGSIRLFMPSETPFDLKLMNENGRLNFALPDNYESGRDGHKKIIRSVRGSGKVSVNVINVNGSISLFSDKNWHQDHTDTGFDFDFGKNFPFEQGKSKEFKNNLKRSIKKMVSLNLDQAGIFAGFNTKNKSRCSENHTEPAEEKPQAPAANGLDKKVLNMLEQGLITVDEAEKLLDAMK